MDAEDYRERKDAQQKRRAKRLPERQQEIENLAPEFEVKKLTEYQYRINGIIDLYPIHKNFHDIKKNKRGMYKNALEFIRSRITTPPTK